MGHRVGAIRRPAPRYVRRSQAINRAPPRRQFELTTASTLRTTAAPAAPPRKIRAATAPSIDAVSSRPAPRPKSHAAPPIPDAASEDKLDDYADAVEQHRPRPATIFDDVRVNRRRHHDPEDVYMRAASAPAPGMHVVTHAHIIWLIGLNIVMAVLLLAILIVLARR